MNCDYKLSNVTKDYLNEYYCILDEMKEERAYRKLGDLRYALFEYKN